MNDDQDQLYELVEKAERLSGEGLFISRRLHQEAAKLLKDMKRKAVARG